MKNLQFLRFIHNNNNYHFHQLLQTGFLRIILKRALRDLYTNFSAIGPFGFSFSVWGLIGSITAGGLVDAILIFTPPNNTAHQLKEGKGSAKKVRKQVTEKPFTSKKYGNKG